MYQVAHNQRCIRESCEVEEEIELPYTSPPDELSHQWVCQRVTRSEMPLLESLKWHEPRLSGLVQPIRLSVNSLKARTTTSIYPLRQQLSSIYIHPISSQNISLPVSELLRSFSSRHNDVQKPPAPCGGCNHRIIPTSYCKLQPPLQLEAQHLLRSSFSPPSLAKHHQSS